MPDNSKFQEFIQQIKQFKYFIDKSVWNNKVDFTIFDSLYLTDNYEDTGYTINLLKGSEYKDQLKSAFNEWRIEEFGNVASNSTNKEVYSTVLEERIQYLESLSEKATQNANRIDSLKVDDYPINITEQRIATGEETFKSEMLGQGEDIKPYEKGELYYVHDTLIISHPFAHHQIKKYYLFRHNLVEQAVDILEKCLSTLNGTINTPDFTRVKFSIDTFELGFILHLFRENGLFQLKPNGKKYYKVEIAEAILRSFNTVDNSESFEALSYKMGLNKFKKRESFEKIEERYLRLQAIFDPLLKEIENQLTIVQEKINP